MKETLEHIFSTQPAISVLVGFAILLGFLAVIVGGITMKKQKKGWRKIKDAAFSDDRVYRYALWRVWDESLPYAMFIGLNPSTADETVDDQTIRRCAEYAKSWGYGGVCMANLFAFRATDPKAMKAADNPIGPDNDDWLVRLSSQAGIIIAAWGDDGSYLGRSKEVAGMFPNLHCLKLNKSGEAAHPLYQPKSATPIPFSPP